MEYSFRFYSTEVTLNQELVEILKINKAALTISMKTIVDHYSQRNPYTTTSLLS